MSVGQLVDGHDEGIDAVVGVEILEPVAEKAGVDLVRTAAVVGDENLLFRHTLCARILSWRSGSPARPATRVLRPVPENDLPGLLDDGLARLRGQGEAVEVLVGVLGLPDVDGIPQEPHEHRLVVGVLREVLAVVEQQVPDLVAVQVLLRQTSGIRRRSSSGRASGSIRLRLRLSSTRKQVVVFLMLSWVMASGILSPFRSIPENWTRPASRCRRVMVSPRTRAGRPQTRPQISRAAAPERATERRDRNHAAARAPRVVDHVSPPCVPAAAAGSAAGRATICGSCRRSPGRPSRPARPSGPPRAGCGRWRRSASPRRRGESPQPPGCWPASSAPRPAGRCG